jgi:hypothetical protein
VIRHHLDRQSLKTRGRAKQREQSQQWFRPNRSRAFHFSFENQAKCLRLPSPIACRFVAIQRVGARAARSGFRRLCSSRSSSRRVIPRRCSGHSLEGKKPSPDASGGTVRRPRQVRDHQIKSTDSAWQESWRGGLLATIRGHLTWYGQSSLGDAIVRGVGDK